MFGPFSSLLLSETWQEISEIKIVKRKITDFDIIQFIVNLYHIDKKKKVRKNVKSRVKD